jgi:hypothetical protein
MRSKTQMHAELLAVCGKLRAANLAIESLNEGLVAEAEHFFYRAFTPEALKELGEDIVDDMVSEAAELIGAVAVLQYSLDKLTKELGEAPYVSQK